MTEPKTVLITGCSSGIGYTTAVELKNRGHNVIASARNAEGITRLQQEGFIAVQLDLTWLTAQASKKPSKMPWFWLTIKLTCYSTTPPSGNQVRSKT